MGYVSAFFKEDKSIENFFLSKKMHFFLEFFFKDGITYIAEIVCNST